MRWISTPAALLGARRVNRDRACVALDLVATVGLLGTAVTFRVGWLWLLGFAWLASAVRQSRLAHRSSQAVTGGRAGQP